MTFLWSKCSSVLCLPFNNTEHWVKEQQPKNTNTQSSSRNQAPRKYRCTQTLLNEWQFFAVCCVTSFTGKLNTAEQQAIICCNKMFLYPCNVNHIKKCSSSASWILNMPLAQKHRVRNTDGTLKAYIDKIKSSSGSSVFSRMHRPILKLGVKALKDFKLPLMKTW